jgi:hypothetical protein
MHRLITFALMAGLTMGGKTEKLAKTSMAESPGAAGVKVVTDEAQHRVDITINGEPFTSYLWATNQRKPVLYPLIAPDGTTVTRGYPFQTRPGERVDHPHHAGLWFNYGNANNFDFWNNSDAIKPADRAKYGTIRHDRIVSTKSGSTSGELTAESTWTTGANQDILKQTTRYVFSNAMIGGKPVRSIDMVITLKALDKVVFQDDKEGVLGMRVAHFLESATEKGGIFLDAGGNPTKVDAADTAGATGVYLTSEGKTGDAAWATRGRWCTLTGNTNNHSETIAILDNPANPGYPTYWHARGYGLFAANPLGRSIFDPKQPAFNYTLEKNQSTTFRYRILLFSNTTTADEINHLADAFAKTR